jgi:hypothetical protein
VEKLKKATWILRAKFLDQDSAYHIWKVFFRSRSHYHIRHLLNFTNRVDAWYLKITCTSILNLFKIKGKPSKEKLCQMVFGLSTEQFIANEARIEHPNLLKNMDS